MKNKIHNHPGMESNFNIDKDHVIIDKPDFEKANKAIAIVDKISKLDLRQNGGYVKDIGEFLDLITESKKINQHD